MMLGKATKKGIAKVRNLATVFTDGHEAGKPALLEKPDKENILPRALVANGKK